MMNDQPKTDWQQQAQQWLDQRQLARPLLATRFGQVVSVNGLLLSARLPGVEIGELCTILSPAQAGQLPLPQADGLLAEVVGFSGQDTLLAPIGPVDGVSDQSVILPSGQQHSMAVSPALLGRVLDAFGRPLDLLPLPDMTGVPRYPVLCPAVGPAERPRIDTPLPTGVRAIDGLLTLGRLVCRPWQWQNHAHGRHGPWHGCRCRGIWPDRGEGPGTAGTAGT